MSASAWSALASWLTLLVALAGALFARSQVLIAAQERRDRIRPAVIVDLEMRDDLNGIVFIDVANIGQTIARDVRLTFDPLLPTDGDASQQATQRFLSRPIPSMPPGKRYRTIFTYLPERSRELPRQYRVEVACRDAQDRVQPAEEYLLDLDLIADSLHVSRDGLHQVNATLKKLLSHLTSGR